MNQVPLRRNRDFALLQLGQGLSTLGSTSTYVAYPLLVLAITHRRQRPVSSGSRTSSPTPSSRSSQAWLPIASTEGG